MTTEQMSTRSEADGNRQRLLTKAYGAATTRLRAEHKDEFEKLYMQEASDLGIDYKPRRTAEQRAEDEVRERLEKFPALRDRMLTEQ